MSRLYLKYGLVAEQDRLSSSADALSVTEPRTGSKSRTKGNLYLVVSSATLGGRARDAAGLVAETIRREYYYDESAGIPICLEKSLRSAERRLRGSREGHSLAPGSIGVALAVIRGRELYVATTGAVDAYLVRAARLLMPEHRPGPGLPAGDGLRVDVWRGEFAVGDSLLLVSRDLTEVVGTEELKNAVVTLHPQSAVEHLHHLFVAAGSDGSDAVLAIESSEEMAPRAQNRLVPVAPEEYEAGGGMAAASSGGAGAALGSRALDARDAVGNAIGGMTDRLADLIPGRRRQYRRITPRVSQRESQRRGAVAFLAFLGVILVLGLIVAFIPRGRETVVSQVNAGEAAFAAATNLAAQALDADLVTDDPERALELLQEAWGQADQAADTGVPQARINPLRQRIATGLDELYDTRRTSAEVVLDLTATSDTRDPAELVRGPDDAAYYLDRALRTVTRVDPETGASAVIVTAGDGPGEGIGTPTILASGGPDLLIADNRGTLWRWRPSDAAGNGTLGQFLLGGEGTWGTDVVDIGTFEIASDDTGDYNLYVADPSESQILRFLPTGDGGGFSAPSNYLATASEDVADFLEVFIDGDIFALTDQSAIRYDRGQLRDFALDPPPDGEDLRPGRAFGAFDGTGSQGEGRFYVWDSEHSRLVVYSKETGEYVEQWITVRGSVAFTDLRGLYVVQPEPPAVVEGEEVILPAPTVYWLTRDALVRAELVDVPEPAAPSASPRPSPSVGPSASPSASPSAEPTRRPRRTPRP